MRASSAKITYSNPASDIVCSFKTTAYNQNDNIQWYFHIFKVQKSKSGLTIQGTVQSGLLLCIVLYCIVLYCIR